MDSKQPKGSIFLNTLCAIFFFLWGGFLINNPVMADDKTVKVVARYMLVPRGGQLQKLTMKILA